MVLLVGIQQGLIQSQLFSLMTSSVPINNKVYLVKVNMDLSETVELTVGARWYDIEVDFEGSANSSFGNGFGNTDQQKYGSNLSAQYAPNNSNGYPDVRQI
jgi:hypothetical protein